MSSNKSGKSSDESWKAEVEGAIKEACKAWEAVRGFDYEEAV